MRDLNPRYGRSLTSLHNFPSKIVRDGTPFHPFARRSRALPHASLGRGGDTAWAYPIEPRRAKRGARP
jgi:hypothetical protein